MQENFERCKVKICEEYVLLPLIGASGHVCPRAPVGQPSWSTWKHSNVTDSYSSQDSELVRFLDVLPVIAKRIKPCTFSPRKIDNMAGVRYGCICTTDLYNPQSTNLFGMITIIFVLYQTFIFYTRYKIKFYFFVLFFFSINT